MAKYRTATTSKHEGVLTPHCRNICRCCKTSICPITYWWVNRFQFLNLLNTHNVLYVVNCFRPFALTFYFNVTIIHRHLNNRLKYNYAIRNCAVALLKTRTTCTLHGTTETYKNYTNRNIT